MRARVSRCRVAIGVLRQWPGGFAVGSRPVGRMGLQCVARVRGVRCVCCVSPTLSRLFALAILVFGRLGFSRLAARVGDCSIVGARLIARSLFACETRI